MTRWRSLFAKPATTQIKLPVDLLSSDVVANPFPIYAELRAAHPVAATVQGGIVLTRHADVVQALTDPRLGNAPSRFSVLAAKNAAKYVAADLASHIPPFQDGDDHVASRRALSRAFYQTFEGWADGLTAIARDRIEQARHRPDAAFQADLAVPFAVAAMCKFCGLTADHDFKPYSEAFFRLFAPQNDPARFQQLNDKMVEFRTRVAADLNDKKANPQPDFLTALCKAQGDDGAPSDAEIIDMVILVFADGIENIAAGCQTVLAQLGQHMPAEAPITPADIREALRLDTPAQIIPRVCLQDHDRDGQPIKAGTPVWLALGSANRDGTAISDADAFQPLRKGGPDLTFGLGRHSCIGAPLGRAMIFALVSEARRAGICVAPAAAYQPRFGHRWPVDQPIALTSPSHGAAT